MTRSTTIFSGKTSGGIFPAHDWKIKPEYLGVVGVREDGERIRAQYCSLDAGELVRLDSISKAPYPHIHEASVKARISCSCA